MRYATTSNLCLHQAFDFSFIPEGGGYSLALGPQDWNFFNVFFAYQSSYGVSDSSRQSLRGLSFSQAQRS